MTREVSIDEAVFIYQGIMRAISNGSPVKEPLFKTCKIVDKAINDFEKAKTEIADKYLDKDSEDKFIPKPGIKEPKLATDFVCKFEEAMVKELEDLSSQKLTIDFESVSATRPVLLMDKDGITKELPLKEFLELSGTIDTRTVAFLNQYFIVNE